MIAEGIQAVQNLTRSADVDAPLTTSVTLNYLGSPQEYLFRTRNDSSTGARHLGEVLEDFQPATLQVATLTGFLDALKAGCAGFGEGRVIHVKNYLTVSVKSAICDKFGRRATLLTAEHAPQDAFQFDTYYGDPAKFIIGLQVAFVPTEELLYLIRLASNLKAGNTVQTEDDGFSQTVTLKAGEVSTAEVKVKPRIKLCPIRTFSEASPVMSEFLVRFRQTPDQTPSVALFNVDGTRWKDETALAIKHFLVKHVTDLPILA